MTVSVVAGLREAVEAKDVCIVGADDSVLPALLDVAEAAEALRDWSEWEPCDDADCAECRLPKTLARLAGRGNG